MPSFADIVKENDRLRIENLALVGQLKERDETIARCIAQGAKLRKALTYYDEPGPHGRYARNTLKGLLED